MTGIITSDWFLIIGVALVSSGLGIFIKFTSRNDMHRGFKNDDLAIGLELLVTALIILITDSVEDFSKYNQDGIDEGTKTVLKDSLEVTPWIILTFVIGLWAISTVVRKLGWKDEDKLNPGWGIIFPNIIGITSLVLVFIWTKG